MIKKYNETFPPENQTIYSLKRKFASLQRKKMPTRDLIMPPYVHRVKQIRYLMYDRMEIFDAEDATGIATEAFDASKEELHGPGYVVLHL